MDGAKSHSRFLWVFATAFLLVCLLGAGFNYLVDPYGLFGTPRVAGFNELKPAASERVRVIKPYMASRVQPKMVIGGNSRPEIGLNPQGACWEAADQPVFNASIPGANVFMQTRYVQHAVESGKAKRILFGVDFLDFVVDASKPTGQINWDRLGQSFNGRLDSGLKNGLGASMNLLIAKDNLSGLFSLGALGDSFVTIASQRDLDSATRREDGFNPALDYRPIIRGEGQAVLFRQKNLEVKKRLRQGELGVLDLHGQPTMPLEALRHFLEWANAHDIDVVLFINPYHSDYLIQIEMAGKWTLFEEWKRQLTNIAAEYTVPLWDFNTIDRHSTEHPPSLGDKRSELQWFWEPAHYRHELGDLMLAAMLDRQCGKSRETGKFGVKLAPLSLQPHLERLKLEMHRFILDNPHVIERLGNGAP
jgi:hypothetical protein